MLWIKKILKRDWEFLLGLIVLTAIVYAFSWFGEFLSDDIPGLVQNPNLGNLNLQLKTLNFNNILNSIIYKTFGLNPFWFHLVNTIFHLATVIIVYLLVSSIIERLNLEEVQPPKGLTLWLPRLTSLLFALHPIETEGVTWISGLPYAAYTFFFLLALVFFIFAVDYDTENKIKNIIISSLFFILALSASEKAVVLPLILIVYIFVFCGLKKKNLLFLVPSIIIAGLYTLSRLADLGGRARYVASPTGETGIIVFNPLVQIPIALYSYIKLLLLPTNLTLYHEFVAFPRWEYYLAVALTFFIALIIFLFFLALKKHSLYHKIAAFGLLFFLISLALTLLPINIAWVVAERYVHLGSVGIFLAVASLIYSVGARPWRVPKGSTLNSASRRTEGRVEPYRIIILLLILVYSPLTIKRNLEWRSQDTLWPATVKASPYSAYAWNNMGDYYGRHRDIQQSIQAFERARALRPRYADATHNLGNAYLKINEATRAAELFKEALEYNPTLYQSYQQLGKIAFARANYVVAASYAANTEDDIPQSAEYYFLQSIKINPDPFTDYLYLYMVYSKAGNKEKAEEALIFARRLAGQNPERIQLIEQVIRESEKAD